MTFRDLEYAFRMVRVRPGSSAAVVLTLALAIAANSILFALVNAALLAPLPVRDPGSLVNVYTSRADGEGFGAVSFPDFQNLKDAHPTFRDAIGYSGLMVTASDADSSEVIFGELVTANYFSMLGVRPSLGRGLDVGPGGDEAPDASVVIGDRLWRRRFFADPAAIGRTLRLNGRPYTIVGVAPPEFAGLLFRGISADVWMPVSMMPHVRTDQRTNRAERWMFVKARLADGTPIGEARAAAAVVSARLAADHEDTNGGRALRLVPASDVLVHPDGDRAVVPAALAVLVAGFLVLLVACANLAGVMLARGLSRRREIAIRLALGASRMRVVRGLVVEAALLAVVGGGCGLLIVGWGAAALAAWRPDFPVPVSLNTAVDWRVALFTLAITVAATLSFSVLPALRVSRTPAAGSMSAAGPTRRRMFGLRDALLVPQIAFALMLVAVAGLFARSLASAGAVDPGFDARRTAFVSLNLAMSGYDDDRARQFYQSLKDRLETSGAVLKAALTDRMPLDLYGNRSATIAYGSALETRRTIQAGQAGAGYFDTMGIRIVRGRALTAADESAGARVAIVSAAAAAEFWPGADPIGQQVRIGSEAPVSTVVGVAADVKVQTLGEAPQPFVYQPLAAGRERLLRLVVRAADPSAAVVEMRRSVHAIDPSVGVFEARSVAQYLDVMLYPYRLAAALGTVLGLLTLALAGVGLYGVLATGVSERLRDLAIRIALGAGPLAVVRSATAGALRAAAIGVVAGGALATVAGRLLAGVLFGISPADPGALVATAAVLVLVVLVSSTGPVRRALRIAPGSILRS